MGKVFVWGGKQLEKPTIVPFLSSMNVIQVCADGKDTFYALSDIGEVFSFTISSLSDPKDKFQKIEFELGVKEKIIMISPYKSTIFVLTNLGKVIYRHTPSNQHQTQTNEILQFVGEGKIVKISQGGNDTIILERESGIKLVLNHEFEKIRTGLIPTTFNKDVPLLIVNGLTAFYTEETDRTIMQKHHVVYDPIIDRIKPITVPTNWVSGSSRAHHSLFVSADGFVYSLGLNYETLLCGETMLEDKTICKLSVLRNVENIYQCKDTLHIYGSNKHYFCLARTKTGQLFSWGGNQEKQLGISSDRRHAIFPCLITSLYGLKISQADCGSTVAIALAENFSSGLSNSLNDSGVLSDLKIELFSNNSAETRDFYLHKCILLARCPSLLNLVLNGKLNYFLRRILMNISSKENFLDLVSENAPNCSTTTTTTAVVSHRVDCTHPNGDDSYIESVYNSFKVLLHYLYVDELDYFDLDLEKNRETVAMVQKLVNFFYFIEMRYWNDESFVSYDSVTQFSLEESSLLLKAFEEWNFSTTKFDNMSKKNRLVRAFALESGNTTLDLSFSERRIGEHLVSIMGRENTCEDYKLTLQSKDGQLEVSIPLHKIILTNSIEFFKGVFESNMEEEKRGEMTLSMDSTEDDYLCKLENVIPLLFNAYCGGSITTTTSSEDRNSSDTSRHLFMNQFDMTLSETNASECLAVANYYASRGFKAECEAFISQHVDEENIVPLLFVCETHEAYSLKEVCIDFAAAHFEKVQLSQDFQKELPMEITDYIKKLARKKSKKVLDMKVLERYWKGEITESDLYPPLAVPSSTTPSGSAVAINSNPSSSTRNSRSSSIFSKIANFFSK